ncbi:hypothetical protein PFFVO_00403 [Plasmodium falciparum Vietnam Oak-Knoll (FVO)]|uniref:phosphatidate phosphatase n=1 Tax=Plasmodium falciparum Vietnam Oak-Knoll (FVO) TaxID=1036723 RepID=A0A024VC96_PLAFA|nr:hypothetical protein PFFVO_00403 [Plasmodium falciparum Vietnam Oak-Knoll (FVO)]
MEYNLCQFVEWGKIVSSVSNALDFNQATLSGCIDIICIESEIENKLKNDKIEVIYKSTPFHVRFGKTKLLRSKEKIVSILVNGKSTNLHMKLGSAGEAYFVEKTYEDVEEDLETSPLSSPRNEYYYLYDDQHIDSCSIDESLNNFKSDEDDSDKVFLINTAEERKKSTDKHSKTERNKSKKYKDTKEEHKKNNSFIKKERQAEENTHDKKNHGNDQDSDNDEDEDDDDIIDRNIKQFNLSDKRREEFDDQNINSEWSWSWGRLPHLKTHDAVSDNNNSINSSVNKKRHKNKIKTKTYYKKSESVNEHATSKDDPVYIPKRNLNITKDHTKDITNDITKDNINGHNKKQLKKGIDKKPSSSLDDYTHKEIDSNDDNNNHNDNNNKRSHSKGDQDAIFDDDIQNRIECSLCGHLLLNQNIDNEQNDYNIEIHNKNIFEANIVTYDQIDKNSNLWYHPSLVFRFDKKDPYYPSRVALPLLASWVVFNQPLSILAVEKLLNSSLTLSEVKDKSWRNWFGVSSTEYDNTTNNKSTNKDTKTNNQIEDKKKKKEQGDKSNIIERKNSKDSKSKRDTLHSLHNQSELSKRSSVRRSEDRIRVRYRKSLRPTSEQLQSLNLKEGANTITFLVTSSLQGTKSITGNIYLWKKNAKIVISDVDGTITRSTVLGHIMPIVGKDWSHVGVSQLFNKINKNGYHILYLTARAIGQADSTREYLFRLKKNDNNKLPDGPLILSPDRLFPSFKREVIDKKPYIFKIAALRDIRNLFPLNHNPFYAAFGNTESDHRAYISVGVPEAKVFIIDNRGIVHHVNSTYAKTYETMSEITEHMFPCIKNDKKREDDDQYNSFQYWKINSLSFYEKYMNVSDSS